MKRVFAVFLAVLMVSSLSAAVSEQGKEAYELGRAIVGILSYNEASRTRYSGNTFLAQSIEELRPGWDRPHYEKYLDVLDDAGMEVPRLDSARGVEGADGGFISIAMKEAGRNAAWFHALSRDYHVSYIMNGEIMEYSFDGGIYFFMYVADGKANVSIECDDFTVQGMDLDDATLEVTADLQTFGISARYDGKPLSAADIEVFAPVVQKAIGFF